MWLFRTRRGLAMCLLLGTIAGAHAAPPISAIAFAPDGQSVLIGSQDGIQVLAWPDLTRQRDLDTEMEHVHGLSFAAEGTILAACGGIPAEDGAVELYRWPAGQRLASASLHDDLIYDLAWRADGKQLALASMDRRVKLFPIHAPATQIGTLHHELKGHSRGVLATVYLPRGDYVVTAGIDQSVRLWSVATGQLRRTLDNHTAEVFDLALRPGNTHLPLVASASADRTVRLWQPTIGRLVRFARLPSQPLAIDWTADGNALLASCVDGHLRVIDPETVETIAEIPAIDGWAHAVAAAPQTRQALVGGTGGQLKIVELNVVELPQ